MIPAQHNRKSNYCDLWVGRVESFLDIWDWAWRRTPLRIQLGPIWTIIFIMQTELSGNLKNKSCFWKCFQSFLPFPSTLPDSTIFRYSHWFDPSPVPFRTIFDTRMDSNFSPYLPGFYHFLVITLIRPFFCNRRDSFSILARILPFPSTLPDSTIFRYSHSFDPFPVLVRTIFRYSHGFYPFTVLNRILLFLGTHIDSTIFL